MTHAQKELIAHVGSNDVELIRIVFGRSCGSNPQIFIEGSMNDVLPMLDFEYDSGYGSQNLFGYIWYKDGTWSERGEYGGSEWWEHMTRPPIDVNIGA